LKRKNKNSFKKIFKYKHINPFWGIVISSFFIIICNNYIKEKEKIKKN